METGRRTGCGNAVDVVQEAAVCDVRTSGQDQLRQGREKVVRVRLTTPQSLRVSERVGGGASRGPMGDARAQ